MTAAASPLPSRFEDPRPIGRGAFGEVWAATLAGEPVAVKLLDPALAARPDAAWAFASEWRTLARLAHPAFPRAIEEGRTAAGHPYYAMAYAAGVEPVGPLGAASVRAVLAGVADALAYLHGLGLVHGDLKPDNLRVDGARVTVLDVGLVAPVGRRREDVAGTLAYMAPEVLRREALDGRADLYALGVLGHELWTGQLPFAGGHGPAALVRAHLLDAPPAPPEAADDPALAALLAELLAKDPGQRPAGARGVLARLAGEQEPLDEAPAGLQGGELVGRDDVLAAWQGLLGAPGGRLAIAGGPGAGKSRTLDALRVRALVAGRTWVGAAGRAGDAPGASLRAVVAQALAAARLTPSDDLAAWLAGRVPPGLAELEPAARRVAIAASAAQALAAAAAGLGGLAIGLDDWQLADEASRDLAAQAGRTLAEADAGVVWAIATDDAAAPADAWVLGPLGPADVRALVAARLGAEPPPALLDRLGPAAAGRPALLDMLLEHLAATGALKRGPTGWTLGAELSGGALPASLEAAWAARLAGLTPAARALAATLAVAAPAGALPAPLVLAASGLDDAAAALDQLVAEGLAAAEAGRVRLAVGPLAAVLTGALGAEAAARQATALARRVLAGADARTSPAQAASAAGDATPAAAAAGYAALAPDVLVAAAALAVAGDDDALAAGLAAAAGDAALTFGAPAEALRWLDAAATRLPEPERRPLALARAEALRLLDRLDEAGAGYAEAAAWADPGAAEAAGEPARPLDPQAPVPGGAAAHAAARAWIGLAKVRQMKGDYPGALAGYARAEAVGEPAQQARAAASEARVRAYRGEPEAALAAATRAEALARALGAEAVLAQALTMRGYLEASADPARVPAARAQLEEALAIGERLGDRAGCALALDNLGNVLLAVGDLAGAADVYARAVAHGKAAGLATEALGAGLNKAIVAAERGELAEAIALAADVARRAEQLGRKFVHAAALTAEAQARARSDQPEAARAALAQALALAEGIQNKLLEEHVRVYALEAALLSGLADPADLAAQADRVATLVAETGHAEMAARLGTLEAERRRQAGDLAGAEAAARPLAEAPNRVAAHAARRVLALITPGAEAVAHAERALALAEAWAAPWHEAADLALLAQAQLAAGDPRAEATAGLALARAGDLNPQARRAAAAILAARPAPHMLPDAAPALDLAAYAAWTAALAAAADEHDAGRQALDGAMALVGAERGYLLAYQAGRLQKAIARGLDLEAEVEGGLSTSMVQRAMFTGEPLYVADARGDAEWSEARSVMALDLRTVVVLPLSTPDALLGVLYMDRRSIAPLLGPPDLHLLAAFASTAAATIIRARAQGDAEAGWGLLAALTQRLVPALEPARIQLTILEAVREATGAERGFWLAADSQGTWSAVIALGDDAGPGISRGVADHVAATGEPLTLLNAAEDEAFSARASVQALGLRTVWCLPVPGRAGELLYLDTTELAQADPAGALAGAEALLRYAAPLLV